MPAVLPTPTTLQLIALIGGLTLGSSVIAAFLSQFMTGRRERRAEIKEGKFAAYELALALEAYAEACSDLIDDSETHSSSRGAGGKAHYRLPQLPAFPEVDWRALGIDDTVRVKSFRTDLEFHHGSIAFNKEQAVPGFEWEVAKVVRHKTAEVGLEAARLAIKLRSDRRIAPLSNHRTLAHLSGAHEKYAEERNREAAAQHGF